MKAAVKHLTTASNCSRNLSVRRLACGLRLPLALPVLTAVLVLATPLAVQAQFNYAVTNQMVTITGYTGTTPDVVAIPSTINGLPVISIGDFAFENQDTITAVTIPNRATIIGDGAFQFCYSLTNILVDPLNPAYSSVDGVLFNQNQTTLVEYPGGKLGRGYTVPNSVTSIGADAFEACFSLANVTIGNSVTTIGDWAFNSCSSLTSIYFQGNAPSLDGIYVFLSGNVTAYYLPGTVGWSSTFGGIPTALWSLPYPLVLNSSLGVRANQFGFTVSWATNLNVVVEAATDLKNPNWSPLTTNALNNGVVNFTDPQWTNYPSRFYRVRSK